MKLHSCEQKDFGRIVDNELSRRLLFSRSFISSRTDNDASSGGNDDNSNRWQSNYSLLAGNGLFWRRRDLSGDADRWHDFTHRAAPVRRLSAERCGEAILSLPQLFDVDEKK